MANSGTFTPGVIVKESFFLSITALRDFKVSSPIMPWKAFKPGRTKKVTGESLPMGLKNGPVS